MFRRFALARRLRLGDFHIPIWRLMLNRTDEEKALALADHLLLTAKISLMEEGNRNPTALEITGEVLRAVALFETLPPQQRPLAMRDPRWNQVLDELYRRSGYAPCCVSRSARAEVR